MKKFDKFLPKNLKNGQIIREQPSQITFASKVCSALDFFEKPR